MDHPYKCENLGEIHFAERTPQSLFDWDAAAGIVTLASFTCQWRDALMGRTQRNQWLAEFESGAGHLENPLFLADVTMPRALHYPLDDHLTNRSRSLRPPNGAKGLQ